MCTCYFNSKLEEYSTMLESEYDYGRNHEVLRQH